MEKMKDQGTSLEKANVHHAKTQVVTFCDDATTESLKIEDVYTSLGKLLNHIPNFCILAFKLAITIKDRFYGRKR